MWTTVSTRKSTDSTDHTAHPDLATRLPASVRGISLLNGMPDGLARTIISSLQEASGKWQGRKNDTFWGLDSALRNNAADILRATESFGDGFHEFFSHPSRNKSLAIDSADHAALLDLVWLLPASARNVSSPVLD